MKRKMMLAAVFALVLAVGYQGVSLAGEIEVTITNITPGQIISPPLVFAHNAPFAIGGLKASPGIEALAEGGDTSVLMTELSGNPIFGGSVAADGPLMPGASVTLTVTADEGFDYITAMGMLVTTNDSFFGLVSRKIPGSGIETVHADAWDAGTEVNNENCRDIPGPSCADTSVPGGPDEDGFIHISNGIHGTGDLNAAVYDWHNPVVQIRITKK